MIDNLRYDFSIRLIAGPANLKRVYQSEWNLGVVREHLSRAYLRHLELRRDEVPDFGCYPFNIPAVFRLDKLEFHPRVTFLLGENGSGKSTLLEALAIKLSINAEGGSKNSRESLRPSESCLANYLTLARGHRREARGFFLRAESAYNTQYFALHHQQSHGEAFLGLVRDGLHARGVYLLDEPESALSPQRQLAFLAAIQELVAKDCQLIIGTHSPILAAYPDAWIYELSSEGINRVNYEELEAYRLTREFVRNPDQFLSRLGL